MTFLTKKFRIYLLALRFYLKKWKLPAFNQNFPAFESFLAVWKRFFFSRTFSQNGNFQHSWTFSTIIFKRSRAFWWSANLCMKIYSHSGPFWKSAKSHSTKISQPSRVFWWKLRSSSAFWKNENISTLESFFFQKFSTL